MGLRVAALDPSPHGTSPPRGLVAKLAAYAQLGKLRVHQHLYQWLLVVLLLQHERSDLPAGAGLALALVLVLMVAVQCATCAADDLVGFRNGGDAKTYGSNPLTAASGRPLPKPLLAGTLTEREAARFAVAAALVALAALVGALAALDWDVPAAAVIAFVLVFAGAVQYSWGLQLSYRPGGVELVILTVNAATILLPYWGVAKTVSANAVVLGVLSGLWFLLVISYGNAAHREGDAAVNRRTSAVLIAPARFNRYLAVLHLVSVVLVALPFVLGTLEPALVVAVVPVIVMSVRQAYFGGVRGETVRAAQIGFRSIDVGSIGLAVAILVS